MMKLGKGFPRRCLVCGFVVMGIFVFALLHALINIVTSSYHLSESGYLDLYSENLTFCRAGSFVGRSPTWSNTLIHLEPSIQQSNKLDETHNGIRQVQRAVYKVNQSLSGPYPSLHAGECVELMDPYFYLRPFQKQKVACFPSFMIVGAMKCGTGELMKWLELHPYLKVISGNGKKRESHFFSRNLPEELRIHPNKNNILRAYYQQLPLLSLDDATKIYTFEKSPDYLRNGNTLSLIQNSLPNLRIVIILRNPIHRVLSEFSHHCRHRRYVRLLDRVDIPASGKFPAKSFPRGSVLRIVDATVHHEPSQPQSTTGSNATMPIQHINHVSRKNFFVVELKDLPIKSYVRLRQPCSVDDMVTYLQNSATSSVAHQQLSTNQSMHIAPEGEWLNTAYPAEVENGFYDVQLEKVFKIFSPSQVLILLQEDMFRNTYRSLRRVEDFLGLPCYDYSQVAYTPNPNAPPVRKARTIGGKFQEFFSHMLTILSSTYSSSSSKEHTSSTMRSVQSADTSRMNGKTKSASPTSQGEKLFKETPKSFQTWLLSVYAEHNQNLINLLSRKYGWTTASDTAINTASTFRQPFLDLTKAWNLK